MHQGFRFIIVVAVLCGLCSCRNGFITSTSTAGLQKTAADYYNFRVGQQPGREYSDFLSPAYRASFSKEDLAVLNKGNASAKPNTKRIEKISSSDVVVSIEASFAMTDVPPRLGFAFESMQAQRWVKVGSRWFLYMGSDKEVSEYGYFPVGIAFPQIPAELPAQVQEDKRRKDPPGDPDAVQDGTTGDATGSG
jgi:hypothetical protein